MVSAETVSATEIKGTVDLTKSAPIALPASEVAKLTADQRIVPFTATLDSQGRIVKTVVNMPAIAGYPAAPLTTSYSDYGTDDHYHDAAGERLGGRPRGDLPAAPLSFESKGPLLTGFR